jgi:hypothetical protein
MHPDQIPEHKKRFPNIEVTPDGCPVFNNVKEHKDYLKAIGWEKEPQRRGKRSMKAAVVVVQGFRDKK